MNIINKYRSEFRLAYRCRIKIPHDYEIGDYLRRFVSNHRGEFRNSHPESFETLDSLAKRTEPLVGGNTYRVWIVQPKETTGNETLIEFLLDHRIMLCGIAGICIFWEQKKEMLESWLRSGNECEDSQHLCSIGTEGSDGYDVSFFDMYDYTWRFSHFPVDEDYSWDIDDYLVCFQR